MLKLSGVVLVKLAPNLGIFTRELCSISARIDPVSLGDLCLALISIS